MLYCNNAALGLGLLTPRVRIANVLACVLKLAVNNNLKVAVVAGSVAGTACACNQLALLYLLPCGNIKGAIVAVQGLYPVAMVNKYTVTIAPNIAGSNNNTIGRSTDSSTRLTPLTPT